MTGSQMNVGKVPKIEWICLPNSITGRFEGSSDKPGQNIDVQTNALVLHAPLIISPIREAIYRFEYKIEQQTGKAVFNHLNHYHHFTFLDEMGFVIARKLQEPCIVSLPGEVVNVDDEIRKTVREVIRKRSLFTYNDTERINGRKSTLVWDENDLAQIKEAKEKYNELISQGFRAKNDFNAFCGECTLYINSKVIKCDYPDEPPLTKILKGFLVYNKRKDNKKEQN